MSNTAQAQPVWIPTEAQFFWAVTVDAFMIGNASVTFQAAKFKTPYSGVIIDTGTTFVLLPDGNLNSAKDFSSICDNWNYPA
jgi:hypothetical protein